MKNPVVPGSAPGVDDTADMGTAFGAARNVLIAGAFTVAAAIATAAPLVVTAPAASAQQSCPTGEEGDPYTGTCVPYLVPNSSAKNICPPGVSGAQCTASTGGQFGSPQPQMPAPVPPSPEEQELQDIATPGY